MSKWSHLPLVKDSGSILLWCPICSRPFTQTPSQVTRAKRRLTCSAECRIASMRMEGSTSWKGGRVFNEVNGYWYVYVAEIQRYRLEHRVVMERHLARKLLRTEIVHHKNHDKTDNRPENLELVVGVGQHTREHHSIAGERNQGARLSREQVLGLLAAHHNGASFAALGREFGISSTQARRICIGTSWACIQPAA